MEGVPHFLNYIGLPTIYVAIATFICLLLGWRPLSGYFFQLKSSYWLQWKWTSFVPGPPPSIISPFQKVNFFGREMSQKYGTVYKIWHYTTPVLVLGDPDAIKTFYKDHFSHKRDPNYSTLGCILEEIMGECVGVAHERGNVKSYRGAFESFFSSSAVKILLPLIGRAVREWVTSLDANNEVDLYNCEMTDIAFKVLTAICYGEEAMWRHLDVVKVMFRLHCDAMSHTTAPFIDFPFWAKLTGAKKKAEKFNKAWREFHLKLLEERKEGVIRNCDGLYFLLHDNMQEGMCRLSEGQLLHTVEEILLFNVDISQAATAFLIADISRHKPVQSRLLEKIDSNLSPDISLVDDLSTTLPYLHNVMKESARVWPALALTLPERTVKDSTNIAGFDIPKNTIVCIDPYTTNFNPISWPEPDKFDPDRFSPDAKNPVNSNSFFRFGLGPRKCLGYRVALSTIAITVVELLQNYELSLKEENAANAIKKEGMSFFTPYLAPKIILTPRTWPTSAQ